MINTSIFQPPIPTDAQQPLAFSGLYGSSVGLALSNLLHTAKHPVLIVADDNLTIAHLLDELNFFSNNKQSPLAFPDWETLPYDHFSPHQDIISDRIKALCRMSTLKQGAIMTTITTLMQLLAPKAYLDAHTFFLAVGDQLNVEALRLKLTHAGYYATNQVREHGEFAVRGSLIDIFPMGSDTPFRIDLFDDEIDSIRYFSPETQRTTEKVNEIILLPAKEFPLTDESIELFRNKFRMQFTGNPLNCPIYQDISDGICPPGIEYYQPLFFNETASLFDYLPPQTLIVTIGEIEHKLDEFAHEIAMRYEQARYDQLRPLLPPEQLFLDKTVIHEKLMHYARISIDDHKTKSTIQFVTSSVSLIDINHKTNEPLKPLKALLEKNANRVLFCAESMGRREVLLQLFKTISLSPTYFASWQDFLANNKLYGITVAPIEKGFQLDEAGITVITETELYGKRVMQRRLRKRTVQDTDRIIKDLTELKIDDPIVHIDHGVGRYRGLQTLTISDRQAEFLCIEYQHNDKLYVPVASLHLISRYTSAEPENAPINKLGTDQWQRAKKKAAEKIRDVAAELLDLYAKREARPGFSHELPEEQYAAFSAEFPFEETPDQLQAIENVFQDMMSPKVMDRVICGDVGFGKTEVALRAAFLAVHNNKQVALLVPTTLLAQQHFNYFQDRFADWPVKIEMLSRFKSGKEQDATLKKLESGQVDIVIGTHKLLQSDVTFKSLGLIIIDEEHRFGVKQKEKLKALRATVDLLTLTATPIPRTLNMALSGIRGLSIIATPPLKRLAIKTFVHEYQHHIIQEAIQREILRGGQVYFLHNDVASINRKADDIHKLVPEARVAIAHGQMHERELERIMSQFYHRQANVLVCSTIIESGIDIPTANTIIINRADKFGLAQLHQLRGRVGRSHHQAYAYLLTPEKNVLTNDAKKRLEAIASLGDLGVGFTLATHDLEIRGAGELLGEEQSGNMEAIGFSLYMELLNRAVDALKAGKEPELDKTLLHHGSEIELQVTSLIPEDYLGDVQLRLQFYKRIANASNQTELDELQVEMIDRFGLLPDALKNLFAIAELKLKADELGISKIDANAKGGKFEFNEKPNVDPAKIISLIQSKTPRFRLEGPTRLRFYLKEHKLPERIGLVMERLTELCS